ncbi:MAG: patatin-like phospholipase family protein [Clostridium sp.]
MLGIALEGGGAKGAFHIGAVKALIENGYEIDGAVGTSIGAFNAALISQNDFEKAYDFWINIEPSSLFNIEDEYMENIVKNGITKESIKYLSGKTKAIIGNRGIDNSRLREVVDTIICEDKIRESSLDFGLVTVSMSDLKPLELCKENIPNGKINDYIMASANHPVFRVEPIDNKYYIDGGVYNNCPVNLLIEKGYTDIIAVRTSQKDTFKRLKSTEANIINITPSEDLGSMIIFDNDLIRRNIELGYYDTIRYIKGLKGKRYYIEAADENVFFSIINNIPDDVIFNIGKLFKLSDMDSKRMLFERIIPTIAELLNLSKMATYQDIFIELMEVIAKERNVEKFKVYTINTFIDAIEETLPIEAYENRKHKHLLNLKKIATELLGANMLDEVAYVILDTVDLDMFKI